MKKLTFIILVLIQTAAFLFTACGRMGPVPPPDPTPPGVTAVAPPDGTTDFPVTGTITLTFSKQMDPLTINDSTIPVTDASGNPIAGSWSFTTGTVTVAVFTPNQPLSEHTRYEISVTTDVSDSYGIAMDHPENFYFTTLSFPPPKVVDIQPANTAKNVSLKSSISIQFSEPMDPNTINTDAGVSNIKVSSAAGDFSGSVLYNDALNSATFYPENDFASSTNYFVTVTTGVNDTGETPLPDAFIASFQTGTAYDAIAPTVVPPPVPNNKALNVSVNTPITATFSKPMDLSTITPSNFIVSQGTATIPGDIKNYGMTAVFTPTNPLAYSTTYTVSIRGYHSTTDTGVTDLAGNSMVADYTWQFTTGPQSPDTVRPSVLTTWPTSTQNNVQVYREVVALFSESMLASSITPTTFVLVAQNDPNKVPVPGQVKSNGAAIIFIPASDLTYNTTYTAAIISTTTSTITLGATDRAGNPLGNSNSPAGYTWNFTTAAPASFTITASAGPGGSINPPGAVDVNLYSSQTFTITPNPGYSIDDVLVDGVSQGPVPSYEFDWVSSDHTISASFLMTITATAGANGSISPSGAVLVHYNATQVFTISPATNYHISAVGGTCGGTLVGTTYTTSAVTQNCTVLPSFAANPVITASAGTGGSITPSGAVSVAYGGSQSFNFTPTAGYYLTGVLVDGVSQTPLPASYTFTNVIANHTISATFGSNPVITASAGTGGSITPSGAVSVAYGGSQSFTFTPSAGYYLSGVLVDGVAQTPVPASYTFTNVIASHTISATFVVDPVITVTVGANGSVSPAGPTVSVNYGANQTFTFTPTAGYYVSAVTVDGANVGLPSSYTFYNVTANHAIAVAFAQGSYTITATAGVGGTLTSGGTIVSSGSSQDFLVTYGGSRPFTIAPNSGYSITSVLVDNVSQGVITSYTFTNVQAAHTITANFAINSYVLTVNTAGTGSGTVTGAGTYTYGATATVTAAANTGSTFTGWSGACSGTASPTTVVMNAAETCTATFTINGYALTVNTAGTGSGTVTGAGTYNYGATATVTAVANTGSTFTGWSGACSGTASPTTVVMNAAETCTATFTINSYTVASSAGANGSITPLGSVPVNYNGTTTFTVTPNAGYTATVGGTCGGSPASGTSPFTYTTNAITGNCTVAASFSINSYPLTVNTAGTGSGTVTGAGAYTYGATATVTAVANTGSTFTGWSGACSGTASPTTVVMNAAETCTATFTINSYTVASSAGANGSITPLGSVPVNYNGTTTFTVTPNAGYTATVGGTCGGSPASGTSPFTYTTNAITGNCTVAASFSINTFTITATADANGSINPSGAVAVNYNANQTFTISPNTGYSIANVLVDGASVGAVSSYTFTKVKDTHTIEASFSINSYTLTVNTAGTGSGTVGGAGTYTYGATAQPTAVANTGSTFTGWSGACSGSANPTSVVMNSDLTCTATFMLNPTLTVNTAGTGSGTVGGAGTYNYGATAQPTAVANTGSTFTGWSGACSGSASPTSVVMNGNQTCTATFTLNTYTLTVNTAGNGSGTVGGGGTYNYGDTAQPTAVADSGSTFTGWSGACSGSASPTSVVINGNLTCTATFTSP